MKFGFCVAVLFFLSSQASARTYFVSTTGNDSYPGTIDSSFATITKGVAVASVGDTIYVRGGTYSLSATITISKTGTSANRYNLFAYPGERPFLDFSLMPISSSNRGIKLNGSYWYIRGFDIYKAGDNGMYIGGSNNIIEYCSFTENADTGLQIGSGGSNNRIINCDSYYNVDPGQGNADGFSAKLDVGSGNYFYGCRSWQNSDDGWDGYLRGANDVSTTIENCWSFRNGYLKSGGASTGNGNGFKMGGSDSVNLMHNMTLLKCLAFDNKVKGFDQNNNKGSMTLYNCTGYRNATNYSISLALNTGKVLTVKNCLSLGAYGTIGSFAIQQTNSWLPPFSVTSADFVSTDTTGVRGPRHADGSLPDVPFMHLAPGSPLIDAGTNVGLPYNGSAPDLGCFETAGPTSVGIAQQTPLGFRLEQNYPNPFNPATEIKFSVDATGAASLEVFNMLGQKVSTLFNGIAESGRSYTVQLNGNSMSSGVYLCRLQSGFKSQIKKLTLLK